MRGVAFQGTHLRTALLTQMRCACRLVQWCHGATGMLITLGSLHALFGSSFPHEFERLMPLCAPLRLPCALSSSAFTHHAALRLSQDVPMRS